MFFVKYLLLNNKTNSGLAKNAVGGVHAHQNIHKRRKNIMNNNNNKTYSYSDQGVERYNL